MARKPGCHSDYTPRRRLPYWSVSTGCGAYTSPEQYPGRQHCESCRWRERMPRESWLRYWWREKARGLIAPCRLPSILRF